MLGSDRALKDTNTFGVLIENGLDILGLPERILSNKCVSTDMRGYNRTRYLLEPDFEVGVEDGSGWV
jgi:hypothetical protein